MTDLLLSSKGTLLLPSLDVCRYLLSIALPYSVVATINPRTSITDTKDSKARDVSSNKLLRFLIKICLACANQETFEGLVAYLNLTERTLTSTLGKGSGTGSVNTSTTTTILFGTDTSAITTLTSTTITVTLALFFCFQRYRYHYFYS